MNKKRVLIVTDFFTPHWTGIATSLTYLIEQYSRDYAFEVLTINHTNKLPREEKMGKVYVTRVPYFLSISRAKISFSLLPKFIQMIHSFDIVFINSPNTNVLAIAFFARFFGKRVVIFHQGDLILTKSLKNWFIERFFDLQTHMACLFSQSVATYTDDYAKHSRILSKHLDKLITFFLIPKNNSESSNLPQIMEQKKLHKTIFGFAGRYVEEKGIDVLMRAIQRLVRQTTNVYFFFAGDVTNYEKFNYFAEYTNLKEYICNLGLLTTESMNSFMKSIDVLVLPSQSECLGLVQIEAFLKGIPVIVSDIPGARIPVAITKYGYIFTKNNDAELAKKLYLATQSKNTLSQYKKNIGLLLNQHRYDSKVRTFIG